MKLRSAEAGAAMLAAWAVHEASAHPLRHCPRAAPPSPTTMVRARTALLLLAACLCAAAAHAPDAVEREADASAELVSQQ